MVNEWDLEKSRSHFRKVIMSNLEIPNGAIAIVSSDLGRFHSFTASILNLRRSLGSPVKFFTGANIAGSCNSAVDFMYENNLEWVWFMGDDHTFDRNILFNMLTKMYSKDLDILTPLCPFRKPPFGPVMFGDEISDKPGYWKIIPWWEIDKSSGEFEVNVAGSAGMLVRRKVFDVMEKPYFRVGQDRPESLTEDLNFCKRARQHGFKILIDLDNHLGHTATCSVVPTKRSDGRWGFTLDFGFNVKFALIPEPDSTVELSDGKSEVELL